MSPDLIDQALAAKRGEITRRLCLRALQKDGISQSEANCVLRQLHDAYQWLGDVHAAIAALQRIVPTNRDEDFELAIASAIDWAYLSQYGFYRNSDESKQGYTFEVYEEKWRTKARADADRALTVAETPAQKERAQTLIEAIYQTHEGADIHRALEMKAKPAPAAAPAPATGTGSVEGTVRFQDGSPVSGVTVTLGLKFSPPFLDVATHVANDMGGVPATGPIEALTAVTDAQGRYRFDSVPAARHEFLAVTLDPLKFDIPTRFLQHGVDVSANATTAADLTVTEWKSAPARVVASPFTDQIEHEGRTYRRVHELTLANPFYFNFPRQAVSIELPPGTSLNDAALLLFSSAEAWQPQPFQLGRNGLTFFTALPQASDRIFAVYQVEGAVPAVPAPANLPLTPDPDGRTAVIDTGAAAFRIAWGEGTDIVAPLMGVRGKDGAWRGSGRFRLPENLRILSYKAQILETGPLVLSVRVDYQLSNDTSYSLIFTAHRDEAYLLVREISPAIEGASFDFSMREFSGGRGYLHWCREGSSQHWTDLTSVDRTLGLIKESVAWWIPPEGFAYGVTSKNLDEKDFIAVFSRRRGEWIDRLFAKLSQGPGENRELDWPFPEMIGSTVSMITAHTDTTGDAYFHFGFFDGERQWGILASDVDDNDGLFKELSAVQHKNSSPRLQEFKDWHLDVPDASERPFVVAHRHDLIKLREKRTAPIFSEYWDRIVSGRSLGGPSEAVFFAIDNNPLIAWRKKAELVYAAQIRSKMILLGRDFGDCYSPVGARPVAPWAESYDLIVASGCFTPEEERTFRQFLVLMGHMHIEPDLMNWKYGSRNANFEADRTDLVGTVGICLLGHPDSKKFIDHCVDLTERSLNVYCTPGSGRWYENVACYYLHASKCRMNLFFHLHRHGLFDATKIPRMKDFLRWGALVLMPPCPHSYEELANGLPYEKYAGSERVRRIPPIGDHAHTGPWVPDHYALAAQMYKKSDPEFSDLLLAAYNEGGRDGGFGSNAALIFSSLDEDDLRPVKLKPFPSRRLEGFGAIFRDHFGTDDEFYLLLKQGPGGYRYHRSEGTIILFAEGRPLLYDGGEAGDTWRHSTLSFYDAETPLAVGHVERFHDLPGLGFVQGVHPVAVVPGGYIQANDPCHHTLAITAEERFAEPNPADVRSVFVVRDEYIILHDDLRLPPDVPSKWHLQVVSQTHTGDAKHGYHFNGRFGVDLQVLLPGQVFKDEQVTQVPITDYKAAPKKKFRVDAHYYDYPFRHSNVIRPADECFSMRHLMVQGTQPDHYLALLRPLTRGRKHVSARALTEQNRTVGIAIDGEGIKDLIFLNRDAFATSAEGVRFEGRYGAVIRRPDALQLFLLTGTLLEAEGIRIASTGPSVRVEIKGTTLELTAEGTGHIEIHGRGAPALFDLTGGRTSAVLGS